MIQWLMKQSCVSDNEMGVNVISVLDLITTNKSRVRFLTLLKITAAMAATAVPPIATAPYANVDPSS